MGKMVKIQQGGIRMSVPESRVAEFTSLGWSLPEANSPKSKPRASTSKVVEATDKAQSSPKGVRKANSGKVKPKASTLANSGKLAEQQEKSEG